MVYRGFICRVLTSYPPLSRYTTSYIPHRAHMTVPNFCIDDPNFPYKGVRGKGSVKIHEDINFNVPIAEKIMVKYLGNIEHPMAQALLDMQKKGQSVILEISPKYFSTWDDSKQ